MRLIQLPPTHSVDCTDDVAAQWLRAKPTRGVRRRGGRAACDGAQLVRGECRAAASVPRLVRLDPAKPWARAPGSRRKWSRAERRPNQAHFTFGNSRGNRIRYNFASISNQIDPKSLATVFTTKTYRIDFRGGRHCFRPILGIAIAIPGYCIRYINL
jgi:hypothetical protein